MRLVLISKSNRESLKKAKTKSSLKNAGMYVSEARRSEPDEDYLGSPKSGFLSHILVLFQLLM